jgi:hypothetical protein
MPSFAVALRTEYVTSAPRRYRVAMRKIPTLFVRDFDHDPRYVTREVHHDCKWVLDGEGVPTYKYDGTCVMFDGERWWARREVKPDKQPPPAFVEIEHDDETGKTVGWEPAEQSAFWKYLNEAIRWHGEVRPEWPLPPGTYELLGPRVNGNPERMPQHCLLFHEQAQDLENVPRDYDGLAAYLRGWHGEGIVWHHPDGRMAKIKKRDFPAR